jgi:hypothetical protein
MGRREARRIEALRALAGFRRTGFGLVQQSLLLAQKQK